MVLMSRSFFFQAEDGIRDDLVTGVQTCALPIPNESGAPCNQYTHGFLMLSKVALNVGGKVRTLYIIGRKLSPFRDARARSFTIARRLQAAAGVGSARHALLQSRSGADGSDSRDIRDGASRARGWGENRGAPCSVLIS